VERLIGEFPLWVRKRSGLREPFDKEKIVRGVAAAVKNRGVSIEAIEELASRVELEMRSAGNEVTSERIGLAVLDELRALDDVGWVRFASVYKEFESLEDFRRELNLLEEPAQEPAAHMPKPGRLERLEKVDPPKDPRRP
jgi:transcriptional repressor NrdR